MSREWWFYLDDLIGFCHHILEYTQGMSREDFEADKRTYDATLRNLELIGEAAKRIPLSVRQRYLQIPWNELIGTRNILTHVYFGVDDNIVWNIIDQEIQPLLETLKQIQKQTKGREHGLDLSHE